METHSTPPSIARAEDVLDFWFGATPRDADDVQRCMKRWFGGGKDQDSAIRERFEPAIARAAARQLHDWPEGARGRLAMIVLLDQFPRNIYRGSVEAFAYDESARALAESGLDAGLDGELEPLERMFFYLPLEHSESLPDQERAVELFEQLGELDVAPFLRDVLAGSVDYARRHRDIIAQFGRFPHRNALLGRSSTAAEEAFLAQGGPTFGQPASQ